jgi:MoaA/NifB/PqqE/SkfB family radical SAM enzyme
MIPDKDTVRAYANSRSGTYKDVICHAPFVNLNFEQNGNVRACCYNTKHVLGQWPRQSIKQIWSGVKANELRSYVLDNNLGGGCVECGKMLKSGNYQGVRARYYDEFAPNSIGTRINYFRYSLNGHVPYPRVMEFELSNECNLECVMCNGYFSSSIRKNREKLPPIHSVYNDSFVNELDDFIPHLTDAKFLGGEPFMIDVYLKIWERILKIKPGIRIHITTNATFLNQRVKDLLEGLHAGIILSIDSVNPETYKRIRINGSFDKVMQNVEYFRDYTNRKKTFLSIAACPITYNWRELPELLAFCIKKDIALYFNAVFSPAELSLREQSKEYLMEVISFLESQPLPERSGWNSSPVNLSINAYKDFVLLLKGWLREKLEEDPQVDKPLSAIETVFVEEEVADWSIDEVEQKLFAFAEVDGKGYIDKEVVLLNRISNLFIATPAGRLSDVIKCYFKIYSLQNSVEMSVADEKIKVVSDLIENHHKRKEILLMMSKASPLQLAASFYETDTAMLEKQLKQVFN